MKKIFAIASLTITFLATQSLQANSLTGTYRCWHFNVDGGGGRCTSPPIVFNSDGSYQMSSEKGEYWVSGNKVTLSESKFRGAGKISGEQIQFEYDYKGKHYVTTYLRQAGSPSQQAANNDSGVTQLDLTISCAASGSAVDWINTCSLDCGDGNRYDALAVQKDRETLNCWHRSVPPNKSCTVSVSSGFDSKVVGTVATRGKEKQNLRGQCAW